MSDKLNKMVPQGSYAPVPEAPAKKVKEEIASAKEKALDRAERKLRDGESIIHKPHHG